MCGMEEFTPGLMCFLPRQTSLSAFPFVLCRSPFGHKQRGSLWGWMARGLFVTALPSQGYPRLQSISEMPGGL